jgi:RNA polymerase sigma-70 factor (ECF subfamily)
VTDRGNGDRSLVAVFADAATAPVVADGLDQALAGALTVARATWKDVTAAAVSDEVFVAYLAARVATPDAAGIAAVKIADLYLACGCAIGAPRAIVLFEQHYLSEVPSYVGQIDRSGEFADEVRQQLSERLLVTRDPANPSAPRKIADYTGRGPLGGWLRVAAVRIGLNVKRSQKPMPLTRVADAPERAQDAADGAHAGHDGGGGHMNAPSPDPELDYLKLRYRNELREAFALTLASLDGEARAVLKMHYLDGLNIDEIGASFRVHRSTVARWLAQARERILEETRKLLSSRLQIGRAEAESVIHLVQSQLDVSIYRYLGKKTDDEDDDEQAG